MKHFKQQRKGFTLIELLTAVAITTVIIGVLIGTTRMAMDAWQESRDKTRASRLAKESMEVMARDLEGIVIRSGNDYEWLYAKMDSNVDLGPDSNAEIKNPLEFVFFSAATDRYDGKIGSADNRGDISAVIYRLAYQDPLGGNVFPVFSLYRKLVNPDETFDDYLAKDSIQGITTANDVINGDNFMAENVYNLTVTFVFEYDNSGAIVQKRVPIMTSGSDFDEISIKGNEVETPGATSNLPDDARLVGAELGILVLSDSGMKLLNNKTFSEADDFAKFVKENSHYFTKSVVLPRP